MAEDKPGHFLENSIQPHGIRKAFCQGRLSPPDVLPSKAFEMAVCVKQVVASVKDLLIFPPNFLMASDG